MRPQAFAFRARRHALAFKPVIDGNPLTVDSPRILAQPLELAPPSPRLAQAGFVVAHGQRGRTGVQGEPGPAGGSAVQRIAGEALSALRLVYELNGQVFYLDPADAEHIDLASGITLSAPVLGDPVNIQISGPLEDPVWTFTPGPVWLGQAGTLTQSPPESGFLLYVGKAVSATQLIINLNEPIDLGEGE